MAGIPDGINDILEAVKDIRASLAGIPDAVKDRPTTVKGIG